MTHVQDSEMSLPGRSLDVLKVIKEYGAFTCTGSCKHIKQGQLHCRNLGNMLGIGPTVVLEIIDNLTKQGLLVRGSLEQPIIFTLTSKGEEILAEQLGS